ncbi:hypothetical protein MMUC44124_21740 [Mycolicibacterium mucogenicum DSM 44124]|nr:hypothetical protein MMUC44124_21740 [Mycolicibacterium mucogenicum DSM 44124]
MSLADDSQADTGQKQQRVEGDKDNGGDMAAVAGGGHGCLLD